MIDASLMIGLNDTHSPDFFVFLGAKTIQDYNDGLIRTIKWAEMVLYLHGSSVL